MCHWQQDTDLAGLRDAAALAKLPADQQKACTQLWADVAALLKRAQEKPKSPWSAVAASMSSDSAIADILSSTNPTFDGASLVGSGETNQACYRGSETMNPIDVHHRWVEWSDEDQVYIGKCPDLITGIHGDDPVEVFKELQEVVQEVVDHFQQTGKKLPTLRALGQ